uniref:C2H2-type domain-containing protein n=1 Tax=Strigamia maritima TaxID=126957 RepID=T1IPP2_STRMM
MAQKSLLGKRKLSSLNSKLANKSPTKAPYTGNLLPCKVQRTYQCHTCDLVTRNPRDYLYHLRDEHGEKLKVYECEHCIYASRHPQKLQRHVGFIHSALEKAKDNGEAAIETAKIVAPPSASRKKKAAKKRPKRPASASPVSLAVKEEEQFSDNYGQNFEAEEFFPQNYPNSNVDNIEEEGKMSDLGGAEMDELADEGSAPPVNGDFVDPQKVYNDLDFKCSVCHFKSKSKIVVQRHEKVIHLKKKFFRCGKCGYVTHKRGRYTKHLQYHSLPPIKCESCDFKTPYKWNLDRHLKNHKVEAIYRCKMCSFAANTKQSLTLHVMNHHQEGGEKNTFLASIGLVCQSDGASAHQEENETKKGIENENFPLENGLDKRFADGSAGGASSEFYRKKGRWCRRMLYCNQCTFATTSSNELQEHEIQHKQAIEAAEISSSNQLPARQRLNLRARSLLRKVSKDVPTDSPRKGGGSKPLKCKHCAYEAKWMSELVKHNRIHTQEKPFCCLFCTFRSRWKGDMTRHVQKYHSSILPEGSIGYEVLEESEEPFPKKRRKDTHSANDSVDMTNLRDTPDAVDKIGHSDRNLCGQEELESLFKDDEEEKEGDSDSFDDGNDMRLDAANEANSSGKNSSLHVLRKCYRCPHCNFTATTASRFHVHIVAHLNQRPFMCSECGYRSNWQWDVTKHIRLKSSHHESHTTASMVMVNEFAHRDYESYNKYIIYEDNPYAEDKKSQQSTRNVVNNVASDEGGRNRYSVWKCIECAYKCTSKQGILQHLPAHSGDRPFFCGECGQSSKWRSIIESHCHTRHGNLMCIIENKKVVSLLKGKLELEENAYDDTNEQEGFIKEVVNDGTNLASNSSIDENVATPSSSPSKGSAKGENIKRHACKMCPYQTRKLFDMRMHMRLHKPQPGAIFKCMFCPFYTSLKRSLLNHMKLHVNEPQEYIFKAMQGSNEHLVGDEMDNAIDENEKCDKDTADESMKSQSLVGEGEAALFVSVQMKRYSCDHCPYTSNSKTQYLYHKQFHRTSKVGPFKCTHCSYSVTKSHLLLQHIKLHKRAQTQTQANQQNQKVAVSVPEKKVKNEAIAAPGTSLLKPLKNQVIKLDELMKNSSTSFKKQGIPSVWVSKDGPMTRMFKCRFCPHVNKRRSNIREHEKMHRKRKVLGRFSCPHCTYMCNNQGVLSTHVKVHLVDTEVQSTPTENPVRAGESSTPCDLPQKSTVVFCDLCPARFPRQCNAEVHRRFHGAPFAWKCTYCTYAARHRPHLHRHLKVHTPEYQNRSKELNFDEAISDLEKPEKKTPKWDTKKHGCHLCPAAFLKVSSLSYHLTLHGGTGKFKCNYCDYAVKNCGNLVRHMKIHEAVRIKPTPSPRQEKKRLMCDNCPATFDKYSRYDVHLKLHGSNQRFTCKHCDYSVKFMANLLKHQKMHEECLPQNTQMQSLRPPSPEKISRSLTPKPKWNANNPASRNCRELPLELSLSEQQMLLLLQHQQQMVQQQRLGEDAKRLFYCDRCPYQHSRKDAVLSHLKRHNGNQEMTCQFCDYSTTMGSFLREHCKLHFQQPKRQKIESFLKWEDMEVWVTNPSGESNLIFRDLGEEVEEENRFVTFSDDSQSHVNHREDGDDDRMMELPLEVIVKTDGNDQETAASEPNTENEKLKDGVEENEETLLDDKPIEDKIGDQSVETDDKKGDESVKTDDKKGDESVKTDDKKGDESVKTDDKKEDESMETNDKIGDESMETNDKIGDESMETNDKIGDESMETDDKIIHSFVGPEDEIVEASIELEDKITEASIELEDKITEALLEPEDKITEALLEPEDKITEASPEPEGQLVDESIELEDKSMDQDDGQANRETKRSNEDLEASKLLSNVCEELEATNGLVVLSEESVEENIDGLNEMSKTITFADLKMKAEIAKDEIEEELRSFEENVIEEEIKCFEENVIEEEIKSFEENVEIEAANNENGNEAINNLISLLAEVNEKNKLEALNAENEETEISPEVVVSENKTAPKMDRELDDQIIQIELQDSSGSKIL